MAITGSGASRSLSQYTRPRLTRTPARAAKAKLFTRDGKAMHEFARGDMYLMDMKHTNGHITGLTSGAWHPTDNVSVRVWRRHVSGG